MVHKLHDKTKCQALNNNLISLVLLSVPKQSSILSCLQFLYFNFFVKFHTFSLIWFINE